MIPHLIHPIKIQLTRIDPVNSPAADAQFSGLVDKPVYQDPITVTAQMALDKTDEYYQRAFGNFPQADGHMTIHIPTWQMEVPDGSAPKIGDRITLLYADQDAALQQPEDWHIVRVEPRGHYFGRAWLWFCFYKRLYAQSQGG